jgi:hypothetical protein
LIFHIYFSYLYSFTLQLLFFFFSPLFQSYFFSF